MLISLQWWILIEVKTTSVLGTVLGCGSYARPCLAVGHMQDLGEDGDEDFLPAIIATTISCCIQQEMAQRSLAIP